MYKNINDGEITNLDILENLEKKIEKKVGKKNCVEKAKKDEYAMLKEEYLKYSE